MNNIQFKITATRFVKFCIVGGVGAGILLGLTTLLTEVAGLHYVFSLCIAIPIATVWNFTGNLKWTFRGKV